MELIRSVHQSVITLVIIAWVGTLCRIGVSAAHFQTPAAEHGWAHLTLFEHENHQGE